MKKIADGDAWTMPATIDDPMILDRDRGGAEGEGACRSTRWNLNRGTGVDADCILRPDRDRRNAVETPIHRLNLDKDRLDVRPVSECTMESLISSMPE